MKQVLTGFALLALTAALLWLSRGPIIAGRLEARLEELGYTCDDLEVEVEPGLTVVVIAPFECLSERAVERIMFTEPVRVELDLPRVHRVIIPSARIDVRRDPVRVETEGMTPLGGSRVGHAVVRMLRIFDMDQSAHFEHIEIGEAEVVLSGEEGVRVLGNDIHLEPVLGEGESGGSAVLIQVGSLRVPARAGVAISLNALSCRVTRADATVHGAVSGAAHIGSLELHRTWQFRAHVSDLDEQRPRLRFERVEE